jgi:hypothetical protein
MRLAHIAALGSSAILFSTAIAGCNDSTPAPEKGGYDVEFGLGNSCPIQPHNGAVGTVSATDPSGVIAASDSVIIDCTVAGTGTFSVDAAAQSMSNSLHVIIPAISTKNTVDNPANGSASFASPNTAANQFANPSNKPCKFWFDGKQTVGEGKIWASFFCEEVDQGMNQCSLSSVNGPGVFVFENCATAISTQ